MTQPIGAGGEGQPALLQEACESFARRFGRPPAWAGIAPGRVNLIGEHTDYNEGLVLPIAIDRCCVCVAAPADGPTSTVFVSDIDDSVAVSLADLIRRGPDARAALPEWARYLLGSIAERARGLRFDTNDSPGTIPALDILATSTVPVGAGLSSSAAIETAAAILFELAVGGLETVDNRDTERRLALANDCQRAEHEWAGVPCGLMDQLASVFGRAGHAMRIDCRDNSIDYVPLPPADRAVLLVINSGVRHSLAAGEYAERRATCEALATQFGVRSLREIETRSIPQIESFFNENYTRCGRHVITEIDRVRRAAEALRLGRLEVLGGLMNDSHASLRNDFRVSCRELDTIVELARDTPGVFGARMTGGGFGGCAIALATPEGARSLADSLPGDYERAHGRPCDVWPIVASDGARAHTL